MLSYFVPYNPTPSRSYRTLDRSFDHLLREAFEPFRVPNRCTDNVQFKLYDTKDYSIIKAHLPSNVEKDGVKINVHLDDGKKKWLSIEVTSEEKSGDENGTSYTRSYSQVEKKYFVDESVYNVNNIQASFKEGVLEIRLPKLVEPEDDEYRINIEISDEPQEETTDENEGQIELELNKEEDQQQNENETEEEEETAIVTDA